MNSPTTLSSEAARSSPEPDDNRLVAALAGSAIFRDFQRAFEQTSGMPLTLRPVQSSQLAHHGNRRQNSFCKLMSESGLANSAALKLQASACEGAANGPCTLTYAFGLIETAVAVNMGEQLVAYLLTGQVFSKGPTAGQVQRAIKQLAEWGIVLTLGDATRCIREIPVVRRSVYGASVQLLQIFADQLGATANQILLEPQAVEPPQIRLARQFIADHYREEIALADIAAKVGMGRFHFCKKFKQATGLSFTPYLSRVRVEKAKNLLLNPNFRVSEIGFESGFQSLTHFNRIFKKVTGYSPTEYREHLTPIGRKL